MTTAAETERAPESKQPSTGKSAAAPPERTDGFTPDHAKMIKGIYPDIDLLQGAPWPVVAERIDDKILESGWDCLADVAEFVENWKPGEDNHHARMDVARERVRRIAGVVQAAVLTEACFTNNGASNLYGDPSDYFNAVVGTIRAASSELAKLHKSLGRNGGAA